VEARQPQSLIRERIKVRRFDLAAECADVGEAQVVGDDDEEVRRTLAGCCQVRAGKQRQHCSPLQQRSHRGSGRRHPKAFLLLVRIDRASAVPANSR
jgi:hypothetical protein